ncbi:MAG: gephyrin-like molybdotransferase Glp [Syntrophobacteraceae bacterium]
MPEFLKVKTAEEVLALVDQIEPLPAECVPLSLACGRTVARDVHATEPVPHFARSTMDGYAVRARDTFGASETLPALLATVGEVFMGEAPSHTVLPGKAIAAPTGGMLPDGADAVVMVEYTSNLDSTTIEITRPVAPGENILKAGEDIAEGEALFKKGWTLRPQDVGVLAAIGVAEVEVFRVPRVALVSTGDEIVPVDTAPLPPGKVRDINNFSLAAQIESSGAQIGIRVCIPDSLDALVSACGSALVDHDMIVLSGGSSVGVRDYTIQVLDSLPDSELLVHGVAIRPGKPVILGRAGRVVFWGLPGQPVSALITCRAFVLASIRKLQGKSESRLAQRSLRAVLNRQVPSVHGRTDYIPVVLSEDTSGWLEATPLFGKSGAISILARADGYVIVPEHVEGLDLGSEVAVFPF